MGNQDGELQQVYQENINKQVDDAVASSQLCNKRLKKPIDNKLI